MSTRRKDLIKQTKKGRFNLNRASDVRRFFNNKPEVETWKDGKKRFVVRRPDGKIQDVYDKPITKNTDLIALTKQYKATKSFDKNITKTTHLSSEIKQQISKAPLSKTRSQTFLAVDFFETGSDRLLGTTIGVSKMGKTGSEGEKEAMFHAQGQAKMLFIEYDDIRDGNVYAKVRTKKYITYR